ncbi:MAG: phosphotransferase [Chloroflexota bacterium]
MTSPFVAASWQEPAWTDEAIAWIEATLKQQNITIEGNIKQPYVTPAATILQIPTNAGQIFFKAVIPSLSVEISISDALAAWHPDHSLQVLGSDLQKGWMLLPDGGLRVREAFSQHLTLEHWTDIVAKYAKLQIALSDKIDDLLAFGTRDRRLAVLPTLYENLLADTDLLLLDQEDGISVQVYQRLVASIPQVTQMCQQLDKYAVPASLHHNDLHDGNMFVQDEQFIFFDWGDSSISHPFFSLRTAFVSVENTFGLVEDDAFFENLADAYLKPWSRFETQANLRTTYDLARRLWSISSAIKYQTLLGFAPPLQEEYKGAVPALLQEFLEANPNL